MSALMDDKLEARLNRLVGQIEGIRKMIHDRRSEKEVAQQILAAREALSKIGLLVVKRGLVKAKSTQKIDNLLKQVFRI